MGISRYEPGGLSRCTPPGCGQLLSTEVHAGWCQERGVAMERTTVNTPYPPGWYGGRSTLPAPSSPPLFTVGQPFRTSHILTFIHFMTERVHHTALLPLILQQ